MVYTNSAVYTITKNPENPETGQTMDDLQFKTSNHEVTFITMTFQHGKATTEPIQRETRTTIHQDNKTISKHTSLSRLVQNIHL